MELVIERTGDELRIRPVPRRPVPRRLGDVLAKLARFSPDFMSEGREANQEAVRDAL